ncbi:MAG: gmd [Nevskia sp.]|nr:gmd [Nevskia sp.]
MGASRRELRVHGNQWNDPVDISDSKSVYRLVSDFRPDQIYYLPAYHHSSQDQTEDEAKVWTASLAVHVQGLAHFLDAIKKCHLPTRTFYASSSRIFGHASISPQDESTQFRPTCLYGITKVSGMMLADYYRRAHNLYTSSGILFNHESPLRARQFVSQHIAEGLAGLKSGRITSLQIGSLDSRVDWGHAPDYTRAMQMILEVDDPQDFVIASGEMHSVREMIEIAAEFLDIPWRECVIESPQILRRNSQELCGNSSRLRHATGWKPSTSFREMVQILAKAAFDREVHGSSVANG